MYIQSVSHRKKRHKRCKRAVYVYVCKGVSLNCLCSLFPLDLPILFLGSSHLCKHALSRPGLGLQSTASDPFSSAHFSRLQLI
ncbi:hypothetical protein DL98DRAFT_295920 [Cadophora sp. DSE1049]|nr:hypothetical protein DL98DRAFT_295920 [Cadophora sp. DSE1049]